MDAEKVSMRSPSTGQRRQKIFGATLTGSGAFPAKRRRRGHGLRLSDLFVLIVFALTLASALVFGPVMRKRNAPHLGAPVCSGPMPSEKIVEHDGDRTAASGPSPGRTSGGVSDSLRGGAAPTSSPLDSRFPRDLFAGSIDGVFLKALPPRTRRVGWG